MANPEDVGFESEILNKAVAALPGIQEDVAKFLDVFDPQAAGKDDKYEFFKYEGEDDEYAGIVEHKMVGFEVPWYGTDTKLLLGNRCC